MVKFLVIFCLFASVPAIAQHPLWNQTNGPSGGSSLFAFNSHGDIFNASPRLNRSTDDGASWKDITPDFLVGYPQSMLILHDYIFIQANGMVYRSNDNGSTWNMIFGSAETGSLYSSSNILYIYAENISTGFKSFARSEDDGITWSDASTNLPSAGRSFFFLSVTPAGELILLEFETTHFYYSADHGNSWTEQSTFPMRIHSNIIATKNGDLFAGIAAPDSAADIDHSYSIHSTDNGSTWHYIRDASNLTITSNDILCATDSTNLMSISSDYGATWNSFPLPDGNRTYITTSYPDQKGNIYWSLIDRASRFNAASHNIEEVSIPISGVSDIMVDSDTSIIAMGYAFFSRSRDHGQSWTSVTGLSELSFPGYFTTITKDSSGGFIACSGYNFLYKSTDHGTTWTQLGTNPIVLFQTPQLVTASNGTLFLCGADSNIIRSTDLGQTWTQAATGLGDIFSPAIICDKNGILYTFSQQAIYRSTNNGDSWEFMINIIDPYLFTGIVTTSNVVCMLATSSGEILAGTSHDGVLHSTDQGLTWDVPDEHLDSAAVFRLYAAPNGDVFGIGRGGTLDDGIYYRPNHSTHWYNANDGLDDPYIPQTMAFAPDGTAYLGTQGRGVWRSEGVVNSVEKKTADESTLSIHISPNPASSKITITYSIPKPSMVKVELCDALGQTLASYANEFQNAGEHSVNTSLEDLTNGIYFIRVGSSEGSTIRKIVINK